MKGNILVIDDDLYYTSYVANLLTDHGGFTVRRAHTVEDALESVDRHAFRLVILDVRMPPGHVFNAVDAAGGHKTGILLLRALKEKLPDSKFIVTTVGADSDVEDWFKSQKGVTFLYKSSDPKQLLRTVQGLLDHEKRKPVAFIVHGRDNQSLLELKGYLQNRLGFSEPIVLAEMPDLGQTIIEKFEHNAEQADVAFVLMTPDDTGHVADNTNEAQARPRQNVIFELGYFLGYLRRRSGRVLVLHKGDLEIPSDLSGLVYIDISSGVASAGESIRRELNALLATLPWLEALS